jgi:plastocyanin
MRAGRTTAAALLAGATLALTAAGAALAPVAFADSDITSSGFSVSPTTVAPGGSVTLTATDCADRATASAPALFDDMTPGRGDGPGRVATATVGTDAKPRAEYDVTFTCGSEQGTAPLSIGDGTTTPTGPVKSGVGGSVTGPNAAEILAGVVLAGATGVIVVRRRRASRS